MLFLKRWAVLCAGLCSVLGCGPQMRQRSTACTPATAACHASCRCIAQADRGGEPLPEAARARVDACVAALDK